MHRPLQQFLKRRRGSSKSLPGDGKVQTPSEVPTAFATSNSG